MTPVDPPHAGTGAPRVGVEEPSSRVGAELAEGAVAPERTVLDRPPLADRQAALVAALVAGEETPPGFDPDRLDAARRALLRKRAGEAARHWPVLATSFGIRWFSFFAAQHDGCPSEGGLRDGWDVARAHRAQLTADARAELAEREALLRYDGASTPRPRRLGRLRRAVRRHRL